MKKIICFVAGHSGGHIIPCLIQANKELQEDKNNQILFFSTNSELDNKIIKNYNFISYHITLSVTNIPDYRKVYKLLKFTYNLFNSFIKSFLMLRKYKPEKIVSMGGLISIPVCLAGKLLGIPIELYELNVEPGKTIYLLSKFSSIINICFKETKEYFPNKKCNLINYPIRFNKEHKISKVNALESIGLSFTKKTILIIGGSQGSIFINNLIKEWILNNQNLHDNIQIIHQTGVLDSFNWKEFYKSYCIQAITFDFYDKMENFYSAADLIICRSGAGTLAEILFFEKTCVTIPLETKSTCHQILNANCLSKQYPDLFYVLKQSDITINKELFYKLLN